MSECVALILEDSVTQANIVKRMIAAQGWTTIHCETSNEAVNTLKTVQVDVLFVDVFVGFENSLPLLPTFRRLAPYATIAVMTAGGSHEALETTLANARRAKADFVLRKPFAEAQIKQVLSARMDAKEGPRRRHHVLIIDDSLTVRSLARGIYEAAGYRVSLAADMEDAFKNADIAHVDMVLCDVFMPGMGGLKGMRHIRKVWPHVLIVAMSAGAGNYVSQEEALSAARKLGADAQIQKPFPKEAILELSQLLINEHDQRHAPELEAHPRFGHAPPDPHSTYI
ncbi:response regulator [Asticcacaulis machinosus]|uniref:Response regulator n=1 Tax=Asticcacaulis machinosus TaxID=2984211 RepID=A0ABT5HMZ2_9CAUL|nr:response regulator [Asticcacaulis machinosus]MDC7677516.1 response regulator [Asticcacaulis machinosus]